MNQKPTILDISFQHNNGVYDYTNLYNYRINAYGYFPFLAQQCNLHLIRLIEKEEDKVFDGVLFHFLKGNKSKFWIPLKAILFAHSLKPDVIIIQGFSNPLQFVLLCMFSKAKFIQLYHGGYVPRGIKGFLQKIISFYVKAFIFTSKEQSIPFIKNGVIPSKANIVEILNSKRELF
jgi:hypothetical protein